MAPSKKRKAAYLKGIIAEYLALFMLLLKGYSILERRYRCHEGEIDLIATRGHSIVFVEVKTRKTISDALEAVSERSKRRISRAASYYASANRAYERYEILRFDVIAFCPPMTIRHVQNAWETS